MLANPDRTPFSALLPVWRLFARNVVRGESLYSLLMMPEFKYIHAAVALLIGVFALYWGITGKDIYPRAPFQTVPLPKIIGRVICFPVAVGAIYFVVGDLL